MKGFFEGLQTAPIAEIAPGYGLEVLVPHVRRQEVDKRCLENLFLRFLVLVPEGTSVTTNQFIKAGHPPKCIHAPGPTANSCSDLFFRFLVLVTVLVIAVAHIAGVSTGGVTPGT
jgi:hypothetical protein